jgi:hypothetical protein
VVFGLLILGFLEQRVFVRPYSAAYQAKAATTDELYSLLDYVRDKRSKLLDVKITSQREAAQVEFTLQAQPETHQALQTKLRAEFNSHKIVSFSSSEQE